MQITRLNDQDRLIKSALLPQYDLLNRQPLLMEQLDTHIRDWKKSSTRTLTLNNPFIEYQGKWDFWNAQQKEKQALNADAMSNYQQLCQLVGVPFDTDYWQKELTKKNINRKERHLSLQLLLNEWKKTLDHAEAQWYLNQLEILRKEFLKKLDSWLKLIQQLNEQLSPFGMDFGVWFDNSLGNLSPQNIDMLKRWADYFSQNEGAQRIAELLGKIQQIEQTSQIESISKMVEVDVPVIDIYSKEEIIGLRLGNDLENALPSELSLMSDPETSVLFDLKYLESKLVCFELQGITSQRIQEEITVEVEKDTEEQKGPMILCVDTSGSMSGTPENIAKAMALFLANKAKVQNRKCFVINFSTQIETFELTSTSGIRQLLEFLGKSFHGGTDVAPALRYTLQLLQKEDYKKADVLIISDFIMGSLPDDILQNIHLQREVGTRFNSLVIGNTFLDKRMKTYFDKEWIYNPNSGKIQELIQFNLMNLLRTEEQS